MKKILPGAIGFFVAGWATAAFAADLPQRPIPAPAPAVVMPYMYDWTGFYIGANGGYGQNRACWGNFAGFNIEGCNSKSGGLVGGQAGYRWQFGQFVFGAEIEGDWANMRASLPSVFVPGGIDSSNVTSVGLLTGQLGYAMNNVLFYLKGGGALANNYSLVQNAAGTGLYNASSHRLGASVGVGIEYGITPNWTIGLEYDYLMMGTANNSFSCNAGCAAVANSISQNIDMVTIRVNYKFGGPVTARY
ncbi:MAG: outer membrane beta-barrel protein [Bradyrhizobium sp.]